MIASIVLALLGLGLTAAGLRQHHRDTADTRDAVVDLAGYPMPADLQLLLPNTWTFWIGLTLLLVAGGFAIATF